MIIYARHWTVCVGLQQTSSLESTALVYQGESIAVLALGKHGMINEPFSHLQSHEGHALFVYSEEVMSPRNPMALRLSANLMIGIVRIHSQQTHYTYGTTEPHILCIFISNNMFLQLSPSTYGRGSRVCMTKTGLQMIYQLAPHGNTIH